MRHSRKPKTTITCSEHAPPPQQLPPTPSGPCREHAAFEYCTVSTQNVELREKSALCLGQKSQISSSFWQAA
ncbi:hypothetical protein CesoFtcFv8_012042 [Champsocephalus esox]|uniref:Uncharacterized protein n=1 Tax=Champsocephalus esox TaxID=159716 RepID=A0AAN8C1M5_9TELE|nr:hypothetical protein CesoFtcFv8_012042 [Champsocephalus esox]